MSSKRIATIYIKADGKQAKEEVKEVADGLSELDAKQAKAALETLNRVDLSGIQRKIQSVGSAIQNIGSQVSSTGRSLTVGLTAPLTALGAISVKSALSIDAVRTKITALVGDSEKANAKMEELRKLADDSVGVYRSAAYETFAQLKGIGGVSDQVINQVIKSMGKLNAAFKIDDMDGFVRNLNQIFTQSFERTDIKEAIGRVPFFEQLLEQAFGTADGDKLRKMKEAGKITLDGFLSGISGAIEGDQRINKIQENLATKLAKGWERLNDSLAPVGEVILQYIVPAFERLGEFVSYAAEWFNSLSPTMKNVIVVFGAIAAAIGPVLVVVGGIISAIGGLVIAWGTLIVSLKVVGIVILAAIGLLIQLGPVLLIVAAQVVVLYKAWQTNFGGIRDLTFSVATAVKNAWNAAVTEIRKFTEDILYKVNAFWKAHGEEIKDTVETASTWVQNRIKGFLSHVQSLWDDHGKNTITIVGMIWDHVKRQISDALDLIAGIVRVVMAGVRGDWQAAWAAFLSVTQNGWALIARAFNQFFNLLWQLILAAIANIRSFITTFTSILVSGFLSAVQRSYNVLSDLPNIIIRLVPSLIKAGANLGNAIWQGIKQGLSASASAQGGITVDGLYEAVYGDPYAPKAGVGGIDVPQIGRISGGGGAGGGGSAAQESPAVKQAKELADRIKDLQIELDFFGEKTRESAAKQDLLRMGLHGVNQSLGDQYIALAKDYDIKEKAKKLDDDLKKLREDQATYSKNLVNGIHDQIRAVQLENNHLSERLRLGRELTEVEKFDLNSIAERIKLEEEMNRLGWDSVKVAAILATFDDKTAVLRGFKERNAAAKELNETAKNAATTLQGLDAEIEKLNIDLGISAELSKADAIAKLLQTEAYNELDEGIKKTILSKAKEIDQLKAAQKAQEEAKKAQEEFKRAYDDMHQTIRGHLDVLADEGFGGFFKNIGKQFQSFLRDMVAKWLTSKFFQLFYKGGNQQAAGQSGGGIFGGILNGITGGGASGGGMFGTPSFNPGGSGGGNPLGSFMQQIFGMGGGSAMSQHEAAHAQASGGGRFSGLFAPQRNILTGQNSQMAGTMGGIGAIASLVGGLIPGRFGRAIGAAGTGLAIGSMFGPIGAAIGGAIGFFAGLFGGDPKRKKDKNENIPALKNGFTEAMKQLREILQGVRDLSIDPDQAIRQATEIRSQISNGFGIKFESKKYRREAQSMIAANLGSADSIIAQIRSAGDQARGAADRSQRILPEWNTGVYMSADFASQYGDFKRRNGMLPGAFTGRDSLPSLLAPGEMVLNPDQINEVRRAAGFDAFRHARIPGYAGGIAMPQTQPTRAINAAQPVQVNVNPSFTIHLSGVSMDDKISAWVESDSGRRVQAKVITEMRRNREIK